MVLTSTRERIHFMSQITGGEVVYLRRVKTGDYEHKELKVTLTFSINDGDKSSNLDEVARSRALLLVEQGLRMQVTTGGLVIPAASVEHAPPAEKVPPAKKATAPRKAPPLTDDVQIVEKKVDEWAAGPAEGQVNDGKDRTLKQQLEASLREPPAPRIIDTGEKVEPSKMVFPGDSRAASSADLMSGAVPSSGVDRSQATTAEAEWAEAAPEVSNATLTAACSATSSRLNNPQRVKKVIALYLPANLPEPQRKVFLIPQEKRAQFITELEGLK